MSWAVVSLSLYGLVTTVLLWRTFRKAGKYESEKDLRIRSEVFAKELQGARVRERAASLVAENAYRRQISRLNDLVRDLNRKLVKFMSKESSS